MKAERRPRQHWRSLRVRALAVVLVVALSPLGLVAAASVLERDIDDRMRRRVSLAAREGARALASASSPADVAEQLDRVALTHNVRLRVVDQAGAVPVDADREAAGTGLLSAIFFGPDGAPTLAQYDAKLPPVGERAEVRAALAGRADEDCRSPPSGLVLVCHAALRSDDGRFVVYVQESSRRAIRALYDMRYQLLKLTLVLLVPALLLAWWLGWRMVRPVEQLRRQVLRKVAAATPGADIELDRGDEFGDLAHAFNTLLARLDERARANEAFAADVAHEFKNPVAAIRAAAESLASGRDVDGVRAQRLARVLHDSSARLDALLTQLLELARAEAGMTGEERGTCDLAAIARGVAATANDDERWGDVAVTFEGEGEARAECVASRLESAVRNLVENAASFARSRVSVRVRVRGEGVEVEVADDGEGIAEGDLDRVFERFFTTRATERGSGLGLAMVRAVAEAHGGEASVRSGEGEGATFTLSVPRAR